MLAAPPLGQGVPAGLRRLELRIHSAGQYEARDREPGLVLGVPQGCKKTTADRGANPNEPRQNRDQAMLLPL